jgi:hypothetical protein
MRFWILLAAIVAPHPMKPPERGGIPETTPTVVRQQPTSPQTNQNDSTDATSAAHASDSDQNTQPTDENIQIERKLVLFTGLLVVVGFLTAIVIGWQSWEARRAATAAAASAAIAGRLWYFSIALIWPWMSGEFLALYVGRTTNWRLTSAS